MYIYTHIVQSGCQSGDNAESMACQKHFHQTPWSCVLPHAGITVDWVNEREERGQPYDIVLRDAASDEVVTYVEVKATTGADKELFEVSSSQSYIL